MQFIAGCITTKTQIQLSTVSINNFCKMTQTSTRQKFAHADVRRKDKGRRKPQQLRQRKQARKALLNKIHNHDRHATIGSGKRI